MSTRTTAVLNRLLLLNGLAIVGVVANHATFWGTMALFWWADRYRPVTAPNYDQYWGVYHIFLLTVRKLAVFCMPAFLFVSGLFVSYMARGKPSLSWKVVRSRIASLIIPYVLWSIVRFTFDYVNGVDLGLLDFVTGLIVGRRYFYIVLLFQLYLFSPFLVSAAKNHAKLLMILAGVAMFGYICVSYVRLYGALTGVDIAWADLLLQTPDSFLLRWLFFFAAGLVAGFRLDQLKEWTHRFRWHLLGVTVVLAFVTVLESLIVFRETDLEWWVSSVLSLPTTLYTIGFTLCFIAFPEVKIPVSGHLRELGQATMAVYLLHAMILEVVARGLQKFMPWFLAWQIPFFLVLVVIAVELPCLLVRLLDKSPARKFHTYLFG
ncbi:MAG: acyltransferase [Anaerolineae bacterium]|nr:acyltransferase [Anaerolineae bacterium]